MTYDKIIKITEVKRGNKYEVSFTNEDPVDVYQALAEVLIAKKINLCKYVVRIKRDNLYNGYQKITVTYANNYRDIFIIKN